MAAIIGAIISLIVPREGLATLTVSTLTQSQWNSLTLAPGLSLTMNSGFSSNTVASSTAGVLASSSGFGWVWPGGSSTNTLSLQGSTADFVHSIPASLGSADFAFIGMPLTGSVHDVAFYVSNTGAGSDSAWIGNISVNGASAQVSIQALIQGWSAIDIHSDIPIVQVGFGTLWSTTDGGGLVNDTRFKGEMFMPTTVPEPTAMSFAIIACAIFAFRKHKLLQNQ